MRDAFGHLKGLAILLWWAPAILLAAAALVADRARHSAVLAVTDALIVLGRRAAAEALLRAEMRRCERRRRAIDGWRGEETPEPSLSVAPSRPRSAAG